MVTVSPALVNSGSVPIGTVVRRRRLDASVYNLKAVAWHERISANSPLTFLSESLVKSATYPGRFKRKYVASSVGRPFLLPSQIEDLVPRPTKWVAGLSDASLKELTVHEGDILLTRSGSVGRTALASKAMESAVTSDDLIRIIPVDGYGEYLYVFLRSPVGQLLLQANEYGAVIQHIEPHHLEGIPVPAPNGVHLEAIRVLIAESVRLRAKAAEATDRATEVLLSNIGAPTVLELLATSTTDAKAVRSASVPLSQLADRLDASFHDPLASAIQSWFESHRIPTLRIGDESISRRVILSPRFKRTYVDEEFGIPLIGGKNLGTLDPRNDKYIATEKLSSSVTQDLLAKHLQVLITRSGTVGKVALCPRHWEGWALSEHIIRVVAVDERMAAYLATWLSTELGQVLLKRQTYGAVVDEIDAAQVAAVKIPVIAQDGIDSVAALALDADSKRSRAFALEAEAGRIFETEVLRAPF